MQRSPTPFFGQTLFAVASTTHDASAKATSSRPRLGLPNGLPFCCMGESAESLEVATTRRDGGDQPPPGELSGWDMLPAPMSEAMARWVALRDIDFDLCVNTDVVNDVLESELNEVKLVVAEDLSKA